MKPTEEQITRWIDGELHDYEREEFEKLLAESPELLTDKDAARKTGELLRRSLPANEEPPYADFFNSQIQKRIREEEAAGATAAAPAASAMPGLLDRLGIWIRTPLGVVGAAAAAAAVTFMLVKATDPNISPSAGGGTGGYDLVASIYTPDPRIEAKTFYSDEAEASVIVVDGLEEIPETYQIRGNLAGNVGIDNHVAAGRGWRQFDSDDEIVDWIAVSYQGTRENL